MSSEAKGFSAFEWSMIAVGIAALYWQTLAKLGSDWWSDENYSHGLLIPFVIACVIWAHRSETATLSPSHGNQRTWAFVLVISGILVLLLGVLGSELFTQRVSLIVVVAGILLYAGKGLLPRCGVFLVLFALSIPLPQILFNKIALPLQFTASKIAVWGIRMFDVPTVRKGNVIDILPVGATQTISLEVVEACSGIRSLMTLAAIAVVLGFFTRTYRDLSKGVFSGMSYGDITRTALLVLLSVPIAVITNSFRVAATGWMTYLYGIGASEGLVHEASGIAVYLAALGILLLVNSGLRRAFRPEEKCL